MPDGCSPECEYNITYVAPAVHCTELAPDQIDDDAQAIYRWVNRTFQSPPAAYLLGYDTIPSGVGYQTTALNFTVEPGESSPNLYTWTLVYVPFAASNGADGALINATGTICTFYNATYAATTHYFNGTQESRILGSEFHDPLNTTDKFSDGLDFSVGNAGSNVHLLAMVDAMSAHLPGILQFDHFGALITTTLIMESGVFEPYAHDASIQLGGQILGINTTTAVTSISQGAAFLRISVGG
jgi:hypothetical protein